MINPIDLSPELEREQRLKDLQLMRSMDKKLGVTKYQIADIVMELSTRLFQYNTFPYSHEFKVSQTL